MSSSVRMKKIQTLFLFLLLFTKLSTVSGAPTLAGVKIFVSYMPYSPNASQIMYLTNEGTSDSKIYVKCFDESGKEYDLGEVGVAASSGISGGFFIERDRDLARRGETGRLS
jgi:hypothetical protein